MAELLEGLSALADPISKGVEGIFDVIQEGEKQIGEGVREYFNHTYKMEEMIQETEDEIKILKEKEELSEKQAEKLMDLELKKLRLESELYEYKSNVDIKTARELAKIEMEKKSKETDDELKILDTKYKGDADLLKLKSNQILNQQAYQPTYIPPSQYGYPSYNYGMYGPTESPYQMMGRKQRAHIPAYKRGLTGHRIEQY